MPAAYIISEVTITNEAQMAQYREWSTRAMQEHGVEIVVRGGDPQALEGSWKPKRIVVLKFKDRDAARAFYHGETYTQARRIREGAGTIEMILVDGAH